ncbi:sensor histidine kinase [Methyloversatilis thermotolerans]|uniref:sensor histidine kinase n=1 Tax=Methyloversatilis thermotolerans TaxID=1346290 RepID=UPI0003600C0C|nr:PAS domain S-box protein [Methyloversatilis thermotolerans]
MSSLPHPPLRPAPPAASHGWYWMLPRVAVVLFLLAITALIGWLHEQDREDQRQAMISDVLWMEQDLRFHLDRNAELMAQLGRERLERQLDAYAFELRARNLIANGHGLVAVEPQDSSVVDDPDLAGPARLASQLGRPVYLPPHLIGGDVHFDVLVPLGSDEGWVRGRYAISQMLAQSIPWWFAERYKLDVIDNVETVLASKSKVDARQDELSYALSFDPPGHGLRLRVTAYHTETRLLPALLVATIVCLAMAMLWSMWALRRHLARRLEAEQALRAEHAFRSAMENSLVIGLRARDLEGRITHVNTAFCRMVGWSERELMAMRPPMPYWAPEQAEEIRALHDEILQGGALSHEAIELKFVRRNGERFDVLITEAPLVDADGRHVGWMSSVQDITERKQAEELYRQQQEKMAFTGRLITMGEMASTLAHELNQPLSAISSYSTACLNMLEHGQADAGELREPLARMNAQARRAGTIIRRVHEFVRRSEPKRLPCSLNHVVEEAVGLIEADARKRDIRISTSLAGQLPDVRADRVMMEQVLLNLIRNGMDAMADVDAGRRRLLIQTSADGSGVQVAVRDHGRGIAPDLGDKLFAPFFTTKPDGMGMGLNICRSIVELHHGRLWYENADGGGTVFIMKLPIDA